MKRYVLVFCIFVVAVFSTTTGVLASVESSEIAKTLQTDTSAHNCVPVDFILAINNSTSSGFGASESSQLDTALGVMQAIYNSAASEDCVGIVTHRVALVSFNDNVVLIHGFVNVFVDPEDSDNDRMNELRSLNRPIYDISASGESEFAKFLLYDRANSVAAIFDSAPPIRDDSVRERAVIIVTDGYPCTSELARGVNGNTNYCSSVRWREHYFYANYPTIYPLDFDRYYFATENGLVRAIRQDFDLTISINVFAINNITSTSADAPIARAWQEIAGATNGVYVPLGSNPSDEDLAFAIDDTMQNILQSNATFEPCNQTVEVGPYHSLTVYSTYRPNSLFSGVEITSPSDRVTTVDQLNGATLSRTDESETYFFSNPEPGTWRITNQDLGNCGQLQQFVEPRQPIITVYSPDQAEITVVQEEPYYSTDSSAFVEIELRDSTTEPNSQAGATLHEIADFPLEVCGSVSFVSRVSDDEGNTVPFPDFASVILPDCISFSYIPTLGHWRSSQPVPAPFQGIYQMDIAVNTTGLNGELINLGNAQVSYTTAPPIEVEFNLLSDSPLRWQLNDFDLDGVEFSQDFRISVAVVDRSDTSIRYTLNEIFGELSTPTVIALINVGNEVLTTELVAVEANAYVLSGSFRNPSSVTSARINGTYPLTISFISTAGYNDENFHFSEPTIDRSVEIRGLKGIRAEFVVPPDVGGVAGQVPSNDIGPDGSIICVPIDFEIELRSQHNEPEYPPRIFGTDADLNNILLARLQFPDGQIIEQVNLVYNDQTFRFEGTLLNNYGAPNCGPATDLQLLVMFSPSASVSREGETQYTLLSTQSRPIEFNFTRFQRRGISIEITEVNDIPVRRVAPTEDSDDSIRVPLSEPSGPRHAPVVEEVPVHLRIRLIDSDGNIVNPETLFPLGTSLESVIRCMVSYEGSTLDYITPVIRYDGINGEWSVTFFDSLDSLPNQSGNYAFTASIDPSVVVSGLPVSVTFYSTGLDQVHVVREPIIGLILMPTFIGGQEVRQSATAISIPIDTMTTSSPTVPFAFTIQDTYGNPITINDLAIPDELTVLDLVSIVVRDAYGTPVMLTSIELADENNVVVQGAFPVTNSVSTYTIEYGLNINNVPSISTWSASSVTLQVTTNPTALSIVGIQVGLGDSATSFASGTTIDFTTLAVQSLQSLDSSRSISLPLTLIVNFAGVLDSNQLPFPRGSRVEVIYTDFSGVEAEIELTHAGQNWVATVGDGATFTQMPANLPMSRMVVSYQFRVVYPDGTMRYILQQQPFQITYEPIDMYIIE